MVVRADWLKAFQSTLPLRGATSTTEGSRQWLTDFNPHSPCGERPATSETNKLTAQFQSTLPLRGATRHRMTMMVPTVFQSTLPLRGATLQVCDFWGTARMISIHTPLAGSDSDFQRKLSGETISIHTPLAGSDRSCRRRAGRRVYFNPHSPCGERLDPRVGRGVRGDFNPHSPCGERLSTSPCAGSTLAFQSTLPLRGATAEMRHF